MTIERFAFLSVFAPLFGFVLAMIYRRFKHAAETFSIMGMSIAVISTLVVCVKTRGMPHLSIHVLDWINSHSLHAVWGIRIDALVMVMLCVVNVISLLVHIYSLSYMSHDASRPRFMAYLSFFTAMMLLLITSPNMVQLFVGWEGVGLASYLLIGFWYERPKAGIAATKAFVVNRVGDAGLILAMGALFLCFGSLDFDVILTALSLTKIPPITVCGCAISSYELIGFFVLLAAMGKSAQFGLHVWLPDAMEGPTPVSALIHAATMVTAGVFLVARFSVVYEMAPYAKAALLWIGIITAFFAATVAVTQRDIKRVIAYSTCSQLGYMMAACGAGAYHAAIFHLATHACFKALLFLGAGSVIHAMSDEQDMFKMGGIARLIPTTYGFMWVGSLAIAGIPFFAGFYSKDAILESLYHGQHYAVYALGLSVVVLTSFYSWRLLWLTFHGKANANEHVMAHVHESNWVMLAPLAVLSVGAIFSGMIGHGLFLDQIGFSWKGVLVVNETTQHHMPFIWHHMPLILSLLGIISAVYVYHTTPNVLTFITRTKVYAMSFHKWWVDEVYDAMLCKPVLKLGHYLWQAIDIGCIDRFGPNGFTRMSILSSRTMRRLQTGYIYHYALIIIVGLMLMAGMVLIPILLNIR